MYSLRDDEDVLEARAAAARRAWHLKLSLRMRPQARHDADEARLAGRVPPRDHERLILRNLTAHSRRNRVTTRSD